jgi:hypothetical protein
MCLHVRRSDANSMVKKAKRLHAFYFAVVVARMPSSSLRSSCTLVPWVTGSQRSYNSLRANTQTAAYTPTGLLHCFDVHRHLRRPLCRMYRLCSMVRFDTTPLRNHFAFLWSVRRRRLASSAFVHLPPIATLPACATDKSCKKRKQYAVSDGWQTAFESTRSHSFKLLLIRRRVAGSRRMSFVSGSDFRGAHRAKNP